MKKKVLITQSIPAVGIDILKERCEITILSDALPSKSEICKSVQSADAMLCLLTDHIDADVIDAGKNLRVISNFAVGYNNIDIKYATQKKIPVTNTPGVLTDATADFAWALLMVAGRKIIPGDQMMRAGQFKGWGPLMLLGSDIKNKTLGIIGAGRIGTAVAARSAGWNMNILYYDHQNNTKLNRSGAEKVSLEQLLKKSDFISIHLPLTEATRHLIDPAAFELMKPNAILINTARGPIVDEAALVRALQTNKIAGAGLDVYENEPTMMPGLSALENVVLAPHIASATVATRNKMSEIAARNVVDILSGNRPEFIVNPQVFD